MKTIVYSYSEKVRRNHPVEKTVRALWIKRNGTAVELGSKTDTFVSEQQLIMEFLEKDTEAKLPRKAFAKNQYGGMQYSVWELREQKILNIVRV